MSENFVRFRLSLIEREQGELFRKITRSEFIEQVFNKEYSFEYYKNNFRYKSINLKGNADLIVAKIGKTFEIEESLPPEADFASIIHQGWQSSIIIIDPRSGVNGQIMAVQEHKMLGDVLPKINRLISEINENNKHEGYIIICNPIFDVQSFWEFAGTHSSDIVSITFSLSAPNGIWSSSSHLKEELMSLSKQTNAEKITTTLESETGINVSSETVNVGVDYAESGSGEIKARAKNGDKFSSRKKIKRTKIKIKSIDDESVTDRIGRQAAEIFGND